MDRLLVKKRILVCEDHTLIIKGLELLFNESPDYELVGKTELGSQLLPLLERTYPDILLLDLNLNDTDGFTLLDEIRKTNVSLKIIILTMYQDDSLIQRAQKQGANGYLQKNISNEELLFALACVYQQHFYLSQALQKERDDKLLFRDSFVNKMKLTRRELELIPLFAKGKSSQQIATELFLSVHTIDTHRKNILKKLRINSLVELVNFSHENKLL